MEPQTEHCPLDRQLTLRPPTAAAIAVHAIGLTLTTEQDQLIQCRLVFEVELDLYHQMDTQAWFNLKPEVRGPFLAGEFVPGPPLEVEVSLRPDLLPQLAQLGNTAAERTTALTTLAQTQPDHPLLATESWFCLSIKQMQAEGETGYRTLWGYVNPTAIAQVTAATGPMFEAMGQFFQELSKLSGSMLGNAGVANPAISADLTNYFQQLSNVGLGNVNPENVSVPMTNANAAAAMGDHPLLDEVMRFFTSDDWNFESVGEGTSLRLPFKGDNGNWNCFARTRESDKQFAFYSVCPLNVPEDKRLAMAEFLTRANYAMVIGNFEMDLDDGEIRYKTSLDVEGDRLSPALIKQVVYPNVILMDKYLPGIMAVLSGVSPQQAIAQVEGN